MDGMFEAPGEWVAVEYGCPDRLGILSLPEGSTSSVGYLAGVRLTEEELPLGARSAWAQADGWPAVCSRLRALAEHLGGEMETQSLRNSRTLQERHEAKFEGEAVNL